jgi:acetylornithine deacetylase
VFLIYQALLKLEEEWGQTKRHPAFPRPGHFVLYPEVVQGGDLLAASIPEECYMIYIIWHPPQDTAEGVGEEEEKAGEDEDIDHKEKGVHQHRLLSR